MRHVATLIAHPAHPFLEDAHAARARGLLSGAGEVVWLDPGVAVDLSFDPPAPCDARPLADQIRAALAPGEFDVIVQPEAHRRKALLVADMDSTMIGQECIDELADHAGLKAHVAAITERAMRGEIAFEPALRERVALLAGLPVAAIADVVERRLTMTSGGAILVATMRANGGYAALVSGGFTAFTEPVARRLGFDEHRANRIGIADGRLDGVVESPILGRAEKRDALAALRERLGLAREATLAVGDGANDLSMLAEAGLGVAFRAKPAVAAAAGAIVAHGDLTALLYLQGYRRSEFVGA